MENTLKQQLEFANKRTIAAKQIVNNYSKSRGCRVIRQAIRNMKKSYIIASVQEMNEKRLICNPWDKSTRKRIWFVDYNFKGRLYFAILR